jgi:hypothetical protein
MELQPLANMAAPSTSNEPAQTRFIIIPVKDSVDRRQRKSLAFRRSRVEMMAKI